MRYNRSLRISRDVSYLLATETTRQNRNGRVQAHTFAKWSTVRLKGARDAGALWLACIPSNNSSHRDSRAHVLLAENILDSRTGRITPRPKKRPKHCCFSIAEASLWKLGEHCRWGRVQEGGIQVIYLLAAPHRNMLHSAVVNELCRGVRASHGEYRKKSRSCHVFQSLPSLSDFRLTDSPGRSGRSHKRATSPRG